MRAPSDKRRATMRPRPAPNVWLHSTDCAAAYPTASAMPYSERVAEPEAPLRPRQHRTAQPRYRVASFNYRDGKPFKIRAPAHKTPVSVLIPAYWRNRSTRPPSTKLQPSACRRPISSSGTLVWRSVTTVCFPSGSKVSVTTDSNPRVASETHVCCICRGLSRAIKRP